MTDKTEEQVAKDKAAVEAMRNAKANMDTTLKRIETLENALGRAINDLKRAKQDISPNVYCYPADNNRQTVHSRIDAEIALLVKVL